jgi:hypothetical protein
MKTSFFASLGLIAILSAAPAFADDATDEGVTVSDGTGAEGDPIVVSEPDGGPVEPVDPAVEDGDVQYDPQIAESGPAPNQRGVTKAPSFLSNQSKSSLNDEDDSAYKTIKRNGKFYKIRIAQ